MSLLGIDVGTTGCKAGAFSEDGLCLGSAYREYPTLHRREGWAELDSRQVWDCVRATIAEVAAQTTRDPIQALAISSMGEAATPVSAQREILGTCLLSSDTRGAEYIQALAKEIGQEEFYSINPNILGVQYSLPKLLWRREHELGLYARADKFLLWGDLVAHLLGCDPVISYSHANRTLLFDIRTEDWSERLLALTGIERAKLAKPVPSGTIAGMVSARMCRELDLPPGVQVVVGGHDQCCNSLGAGIYTAGKAVCGIGTFECITPSYARIPESAPMLRHGFNVEHHILPGLYVSFIYNQSGSLVRWFRDTFARTDRNMISADGDVYDRLAAEMPAEPTRLYTLPYFETTGPPHFVADASGVILGLKTVTSRGEILKSIMESTAFYLAASTQALAELGVDISEFVATGGGAKSDAWLQIKADIFGAPFVRLCITEGSVLGAAMLAGIATGVFSSPAEAAAKLVKRGRVFEPDPRRHRIYQEKLQAYRELFPLLKEFLVGHERAEKDRSLAGPRG